MEQFAKKLTLQLELNEISKHRIEVLESIFKSHKGKNSLNFVVYDNDEKIKLNLPSQKVKVNITQELINVLEEQSLVYKLN